MRLNHVIFILIIAMGAILIGCNNNQNEGVSTPKEEARQTTEAPSQTALEKIENINDFSLDIDFQNGDEVEYDYEVKTDRIEAEVDKRTGSVREDIVGEQALTEIRALIDKVKPTSEQTGEQLAEQFLQALNLKREEIKQFDLEIRFSDGKKIEYKF